ncbi:hypothetical protein [Shewanella halotolerans]|uniref:hypothetical protein n=1 Tax=Shewanella halotolerans TaxID=2864204 RepID=UPI001C65F37E|nr:hypothetical protein [Shewanella halotolerans]QYJ89068.1 hypothetical protein K0H81_14980 [Shewanella halotolerans]
MRIIQVLLITLLVLSPELKAIPDLHVPLNKLTLVSDKLTLTIFRDGDSDRVKNVEVKSANSTFTIDSEVFDLAYAVDLQEVTLTQTIDLENGLMEDYQLYIPYNLHSDDGLEPPEEQKLKTQKLVIYFDNTQVKRIFTK